MSESLQKAGILIESTEKCKENFSENKNKTIIIQFEEEEEESCNQSSARETQKFDVEIVMFVAKKLKDFFKQKGWFAMPKLTKKMGELKTTTENRCSMRDLAEDFRFYLRRQYFAETCDKEMPPFYYTTQSALFQMASTLGFRVVKPRNRLILKYHSF